MIQIDYPYSHDGRGRTALTSSNDHIRDLIEQVLFTVPGERVNRPSFGSGLLQLVFAPNSEAIASALQISVQASLQEWLGDLIEVGAVEIEAKDASLFVQVQYAVRSSNERQTVQFQRGF